VVVVALPVAKVIVPVLLLLPSTRLFTTSEISRGSEPLGFS